MLKMPWPRSTRRLMRKELKVSQIQTLQQSTGLLTLTRENTRVFSVLLLSQARSKRKLYHSRIARTKTVTMKKTRVKELGLLAERQAEAQEEDLQE